jgi:hypothetical protein
VSGRTLLFPYRWVENLATVIREHTLERSVERGTDRPSEDRRANDAVADTAKHGFLLSVMRHNGASYHGEQE